MAISNTNKSLSLPLLAFSITIFLFLLNNRVQVHSLRDSISFSFPYFEADQENLVFYGIARTNASTKFLQLTNADPESPRGRVIFRSPFRLWETPSEVASFESNFTFSISSLPNNPNTPAEGFTFFISSLQFGPFFNPLDGIGGLLGLVPEGKEPESENIVAIEFDTYSNAEYGDPNYRHIGIDINSPRSNKTAKWEWQNGKVATARIKYDSTSKTLTAVTYYDNSSEIVSVSQDIDLGKILPQYAQVGFSASTGPPLLELINIHSWSFGSILNYN